MSRKRAASVASSGAQRAPGLPRAVADAWGVTPPPRKGPKPGLDLDRIVAAAVAIADSEGLGAVSMNRVAKDLGSSAMSLYRYLDSKEELVLLMVDAALGPVAAGTPDEHWRERLARWADGFWRTSLAHAWSVRVPISGPPLTPNSVAWFEEGLAAMSTTHLLEQEKASVVLMVTGYVRNHVMLMSELGEFLAAAPKPDDAMRAYSETLRGLLDAKRFPAVHALLDAHVLERADPPEQEFVFGLDRILDGVQVLALRRAGERTPG